MIVDNSVAVSVGSILSPFLRSGLSGVADAKRWLWLDSLLAPTLVPCVG